MEYQVWVKDEYEGWKKTDCGDMQAALRAIIEAHKKGLEPLLTESIPFEVFVNIRKEEQVETKEGEAEHDKGTGDKSHRTVRRGDAAAT